MEPPPQPRLSRRSFLAGTGASLAAISLGLVHLRCKNGTPKYPVTPMSGPLPSYGGWGDLYRDKWTWDRVVKGTHNRANCFSACSWDLFVKDGVVWREEQAAIYEQTNTSVPDFNPRGCQKGACYSDLQLAPSRVTYPLKRVGKRGSGQWKRVSWDEALSDIADHCIDAAVAGGTETVVHDHGTTNNEFGPDSSAEMRWIGAFGATQIDSWGGVGDMPNGILQTWGMYNADGTTDDWFRSDYIVLWVSNPAYTRMPDVHFVHEARYRGAQLVTITPDLNASSIHADLWINPNHETDASFGLATAHVILEEGLYDDEAVREQTDLPFLVREDTGRYLREQDLKRKGKDDLFYLWDEAADEIATAPGCAGEGGRSLALGDRRPALDGRWQVDLAGGGKVWVRPLFQVLRDHLRADYTPEKSQKITGVNPAVVRRFARELAAAPAAMIYTSWGSCKNYHSDLFQRAITLLMAITGNQGKHGGGVRVAAWWQLEGADQLGSAEYRPPMIEGLKLLPKFLRGMTPREWEQTYTDYSAYFAITPLMPFLYVHGGYDKAWDLPEHQDPSLPRHVRAYMDEAIEKGWIPIHPEPGNRPRVYIFTGCNPLRRWPIPQYAKKYLWPKFDLIVSTNFRMSTSSMHADYVLPVAAYYEKYGIKYGVSALPYLITAEKATEPLGEAKCDWEIFGLLTKRVQERAIERGISEVKGPNGRKQNLATLYDWWSEDGDLDPKNPRAVIDRVFRRSDIVGNISGDEALRLGAVPVVKGGTFTLVNQTASDFEPGETFAPFQWFTQQKLAWPTLTGRQQFLLDHPWFLEGGESLPVHKDSPGMGRPGLPLRLTSGHNRWSIHAIQRDQDMLLRLQRGEPVVFMNPSDLRVRGIADHDMIRVRSDEAAFEARVKPATRVQPGEIIMYHAWEPYQFADWKGPQEPVVAPWKPLHLAGGYGQLHYRMYYNAPGHCPRGIAVEAEKVA